MDKKGLTKTQIAMTTIGKSFTLINIILLFLSQFNICIILYQLNEKYKRIYPDTALRKFKIKSRRYFIRARFNEHTKIIKF